VGYTPLIPQGVGIHRWYLRVWVYSVGTSGWVTLSPCVYLRVCYSLSLCVPQGWVSPVHTSGLGISPRSYLRVGYSSLLLLPQGVLLLPPDLPQGWVYSRVGYLTAGLFPGGNSGE